MTTEDAQTHLHKAPGLQKRDTVLRSVDDLLQLDGEVGNLLANNPVFLYALLVRNGDAVSLLDSFVQRSLKVRNRCQYAER